MLNNVRNGESECDGVRHDASCVDAWLAPEGAGQRSGVSLVRHFGGSAVVVGAVVRPYHHMVGSSDFVSFDLPSVRLQRAISWLVKCDHVKDTMTLSFAAISPTFLPFSAATACAIQNDTCILLHVAICLLTWPY